MPGFMPGIAVFAAKEKRKEVDGRDIRALAPVFARAIPGHNVS